MTSEPLKPCGCGKTPTKLHAVYDPYASHGHVYGDCCTDWRIAFPSERLKEPDISDATLAWNEAERCAPTPPPKLDKPDREGKWAFVCDGVTSVRWFWKEPGAAGWWMGLHYLGSASLVSDTSDHWYKEFQYLDALPALPEQQEQEKK